MIDSKLILILLVAISTTLAELNGKCQGRSGICIKTSECQSYGGTTYSGYCPIDPPDVLCCDNIKCSTNGNTGKCLFTDQCSKDRADGLCPGGSDFKCCLEGPREVIDTAVTRAELDKHIAKAYHYAHKYCHYALGAGGRFPPMESGIADCFTLASRALYTLGIITSASELDLDKACKKAGLVSSTDENDAWRHHGIVLVQDLNQKGTNNWSHVFYSLGGTDTEHISKYDLGMESRIKIDNQPYPSVPVNEWKGRRVFLKIYYPKK